eukprot:evm.model.scf_1104EXC.1 EVM.evm.TU.scf_1104EXC.1   scf_1104EXC:11822-28756(-)
MAEAESSIEQVELPGLFAQLGLNLTPDGGLPPHFGTQAMGQILSSLSDWLTTGLSGGWNLETLQATVNGMQASLQDLEMTGLGLESFNAIQQVKSTVADLEQMLQGSGGPLADLQVPEVGAAIGSVLLLSAAAVLLLRLTQQIGSSETLREEDIPKEYSPEKLAEYFSTKKATVWRRSAYVSANIGRLVLAYYVDKWTGKLEANAPVRAVELRTTIERLGPTFVKVAQAISTRVDMLSAAYMAEIKKLQDQVPPFDSVAAKQVLEGELGRKVEDVFSTLSKETVAAASLGQVYRGILRPEYGGGEVAVKVQRPGVLRQVALDLHVIRELSILVKQIPKSRFDFVPIIDEWATRFFQEMDFKQETVNAIKFKEDMKALEGIVVPNFYSNLATRKVLVSEWVEGEKLIESTASDVRELCNTLLNCYLIQLLDTGFLHGDPHPGNLIRTPDGKICILDFGMMTQVTQLQRDNLVEYIANITMEDWEGVAVSLKALGFIPEGSPDPRETGLIEPLRMVFSQMKKGGGVKKFREMRDNPEKLKQWRRSSEFAKMQQDMEALAEKYPFKIPSFFTLILRAFSVIEGIALGSDPDYAIVQECFPYLSKRLLTDNTPRMNKVLRGLLYGNNQRLNVARFRTMTTALREFTVDGLDMGALTGRGGPAGPTGAVTALARQRRTPVVDATMKEALQVVFAPNGSYLQDLLVDELVAAVDALSREASSRLFASYLGSLPATATFRAVEALGPLRSFVFPFITPAEVIARLAPAVAVTEEDEEALSVVRGIFQIVDDVGATLQTLSDVPVSTQAAQDLAPILPKLAPGVARVGELFTRRLLSRIVMRFANALANSPYDMEESMGGAMEDLRRVSGLLASIDAGLSTSELAGCDRLRRCICDIAPLLDRLKRMACPWGPSAMRALAQLQAALERTDRVIRNCAACGHCDEGDCELLGALRQLWQRQIEMNLAVQFQNVLDEDGSRGAKGLCGESEKPPGGLSGLIGEKIGLERPMA